jgi:hypothetical protein
VDIFITIRNAHHSFEIKKIITPLKWKLLLLNKQKKNTCKQKFEVKYKEGCDNFDVRKSVHHHTIQIIQLQDATVSQVYYLTFMCGSTCFGRLPAHHQEHTTALEASGFTVGERRLERCWASRLSRGQS